MARSLDTLHAQQILYAENVIAIKNTIATKYPHASPKERADILAKAIKHILHTNLSSFDTTMQHALVQDLLKVALQKQDFSINAHDVVISYATIATPVDIADLTPLTIWLNEITGEALSSEEILNTFTCFKPLSSNDLTIPSISNETSCMDLPNVDLASDRTNLEPALSATNCPTPMSRFPYQKTIFTFSTLCIATSIILLVTTLQPTSKGMPVPLISPTATMESTTLTFLIPEEDYLMPHLQYKEVNEIALKEYLNGRNSLLTEEPYFSAILEAAASYNINPLLMFAITGQEQGFVPRTNKHAQKIANNPFNVYGSWEDFNTDIYDTSLIAARTIINLSKGCPSDADPIKWLNNKYAEDPKWHNGVSYFLRELEKISN